MLAAAAPSLFMEQIAYILLGWCLGLASHLLIAADYRRKQKKELVSAIATELKELQFTLASAVYRVAVRHGNDDRKLLEWLKPIQEQHSKIRPSEVFVDNLNYLLKGTDAELAASSQAMRQKESSRALAVKKFEVPFLDTQLGQLSMLEPRTQQALLHIRWKLSLINQEVDDGREWFRMTYRDPDKSIEHNLEATYDQLAYQARAAVDLITTTLPMLEVAS